MRSDQQEEQGLVITLSDCFKIIKKKKWTVFASSASCAALLGFYTLIKPITYEAEATFKEKGNAQGKFSSNSVASVLIDNLSGGKSEAKSIMQSRSFMEKVVQASALNANVSKKTTFPRIRAFFKNLRVEYSYLSKKNERPLADYKEPLILSNVIYQDELSINLRLEFDTEDEFTVFHKDISLGNGKIGVPFQTSQMAFTILKREADENTFYLTLSPIVDVANALTKQVEIIPSKEDPTLLKLKFKHQDRYKASGLLNQIMAQYQEYLKSERDLISTAQLAYLSSREDEMGNALQDMLQSYAKKISTDVSMLGYPDSETGMNFLARELESFKNRQLLISLELSMLNKFIDKTFPIDSPFLNESIPKLSKILEEMRFLKQQRDGIELGLRSLSGESVEAWQNSFTQQVAELDDIRSSSIEVLKILDNLDSPSAIMGQVALLDHPKFPVRTWHEQMLESDKNYFTADPFEKNEKKKERDQVKEQYTAYLKNLLHYLEVHEKATQERLSHQQAPSVDFQGIDLRSSERLYVEHIHQLSLLESNIKQLSYLIDRIKEPEFELSSLGTILTDPVTVELVKEASAMALAIQDEANRGPKERERLKKELVIQKKFLDLHLRQSLQLQKLQEDLVKTKIQSLNNSTLELIHQQLSILESQILDGIETQIEKLHHENELISQQEVIIRQEMSKLPQKWATEKLIDHQVKINTIMVEELTKLVESKNIASNLELVQSAPLDEAVPPLKPVRPKLILFSLVGALLGMLMSIGALFARTLSKGIPVSKENLEVIGLHVSGASSQGLAPLRRLLAHVQEGDAKGKTMALMSGGHAEPSKEIASLLAARGEKAAVVDLRFQKPAAKEELPGVLQYLEGSAAIPKISTLKGVGYISSGGSSIHAAEFIQSRKIYEYLNHLKEEFDWVIVITSMEPTNSAIEGILKEFDYSVLVLGDETLDALQPTIKAIRELPDSKKVSFLFAQ